MKLTSSSLVGTVAAEHPSTVRVFQRHGIDFCCGGKRALGEVAARHGLDEDSLLAELEAVVVRPGGPAGGASEDQEAPLPSGDTVAGLIARILSRYHAELWRELPRLAGMADKVLRAHGERHPESVPAMHRLFGELRAELEPHLIEEEDAVFPALVAVEMRRACGRPDDRATPLPGTQRGLDLLEAQHERVGRLLRELRATTSGYVPPEDACNTFRGLLHGLAELEREVHEHVHLENNVLFPMVAQLRAEPALLPAV